MGVSIVWFAACGGEPFSTDGAAGGDAGTANGSVGAGGTATGSGGSKAGGSGKAGSSAGRAGDTSSGGVVGVGGDVGIAGVVGVSGSMTGGAGAPPCGDPSMCPTSSACVEATCNSGECGEEALPDGPFELQMPGDCKQARCEGGKEVFVADPTDKDDQNPCTKDACGANGTAMHVAQTGQACGAGGLCSPEGKCEVCPNACLAPADACQVAYCEAGTCQVGPAPIDKLCPLVSSPNDTYGQCDGQGHCVDCTNTGACDEASVCSADHQCVPD
jgi:hypothetical protein